MIATTPHTHVPHDVEQVPRRIQRCGTDEAHRRLLRIDPEYRWRRQQIEREIGDWIGRFGGDGLRTGLIRIPVVVHVIWNTAAQNISDAQIQSQIDVLNRDFRRLNADAGMTPAVFAGVAADARLEFALAVRAPGCVVTNGITRTNTAVTGWTRGQESMKSAATGGQDPWDVTRYLNVWVVNYTDGLLGYGTFPGMPANIQGITCDYRAFGTIGTLTPNAHLGRTMTHEVGHYLDIFHIWGDDVAACTGSDEVTDTPNQADSTAFGPCPSFPQVSCLNGPNGDMFMNYMDYSGDQCFNLFTAGQVVRMDAALHTQRASLLASDGLVPAGGSPGPDLWMKDVSDDFGAEPDPSAQPMWISDDIYVRRTNDGLMTQDHQNPEYRVPGSAPNYVYVRVRNRGCSGSQSGTVRLYWAKASTGLSWPAPWDGSVTAPVLMGGSIGSQPVSVAAGDDDILAFPWSPPNPADYAVLGADQAHFCLLARIETSPAMPYGMTFPETGNLYANVQNNNNIVWKNITVVDEQPGQGRMSGIILANFSMEIERAMLVFTSSEKEGVSIFDWGQVFVDLTPHLMTLAAQGGVDDAVGVKQVDDNTFRVLGPGARLGPFELAPGAMHGLQVRFVPRTRQTLGARVLALDVVQRTRHGVVGGQRFVIKTLLDRRCLVPGSAAPGGTIWTPGAHTPGTAPQPPRPCGCGGK